MKNFTVGYPLRNYFSFGSHPAFGASAHAWFKILRQNSFSVHPLFLPKAIALTAATIFFSPFRLAERWRYGKKLQGIKVQNPVFIIGHPRSGTTFLHTLMSRDPAFGYCTTLQTLLPHTFLSSGKTFSGMISNALPDTRPMDNVKMGADLPAEEEFALAGYGPESLVTGYYFPKNFLKNLRRNVLFETNANAAEEWKRNYHFFLRKLTFAHAGKRLILKSPANTARIPEILSLFPDAVFIHIYRNPYDVIQSHLHLFRKILPLFALQHITEREVEEIVFTTYSDVIEKYFADRDVIPKGNLAEIRYETFVRKPMAGLDSIYQTLSLEGFQNARPFFESELKDQRDYHKNKFTLNQELETKIESRLRFAFEQLGYDSSVKPG